MTTEGINTVAASTSLKAPRHLYLEDFPIGSIVITPLGQKAKVIKHLHYERSTRERLLCEYLEPVNKKFARVWLLPELVSWK